jgi:hypothetical protein
LAPAPVGSIQRLCEKIFLYAESIFITNINKERLGQIAGPFFCIVYNPARIQFFGGDCMQKEAAAYQNQTAAAEVVRIYEDKASADTLLLQFLQQSGEGVENYAAADAASR